MERRMFYDAKPETFERARNLRAKMTHEEKILWEKLNNNQLGYRFKPQHPVDIYIADFYCHKLKLIIEVDGSSHDNKMERDQNRTSELNNFGITVIRFSNQEVLNETEKIVTTIKSVIENLKQKQHPL